MSHDNDNFDALWAQFRTAIAEARTKYASGSKPLGVDADNAFSSTYAYVSAPYMDRTAALNIGVAATGIIEANLQPDGLVAIAGHCMAAAQIIHERRAAAQVEQNTRTDAQDAQ